jgi:hypothetical protein
MSEATARVTFSAVINESGTIIPDEPNKVRGRLSRFCPKKNRRVTVTVTRYVPPKSQPQLGLYFRDGGILDSFAEFVGDDRDAMHRDLKRTFLAPQLVLSRLTGEQVPEIPSLADLNEEEMSAFLNRGLMEGRKMGVTFECDQS